ncbi:MAG: purine-nucleoside phosphorylase [candidate division Zixibacteria bacterium 4484_95]|nr:MAG: purine-nucleoside phosphorylase [candidate division Zixibacteria bacterium 4484_95]
MKNLRQTIDDSVAFIRTKTKETPKIGIILGTGLGALSKTVTRELEIPYELIPHFPVSTVESHAGRLLFGTVGVKKVVAMEGRFHHYEGYSFKQVTFPIRVMKALGIEILVVSNAAGALNPQFSKGDIVLITDHINLQGGNPLIGKNDDELGPRFPDMYDCYDKELRELAIQTALDEKINLQRGVYIGVAGPNLETAAEYRFLRTIGGDLVGMSSVPEVIVARHQGTRVIGFSVVTDMGLADALEPCSHEKIVAAAEKAGPILSKLIEKTIKRMKV